MKCVTLSLRITFLLEIHFENLSPSFQEPSFLIVSFHSSGTFKHFTLVTRTPVMENLIGNPNPPSPKTLTGNPNPPPSPLSSS